MKNLLLLFLFLLHKFFLAQTFSSAKHLSHIFNGSNFNSRVHVKNFHHIFFKFPLLPGV